MNIPIIKAEEMSPEELETLSEKIKKEEKERKKLAKEYKFTKEDISEFSRRINEGEDIDEVERSITERGIAAQRGKPLPEHLPLEIPLRKEPTETVPIEIIPPVIKPIIKPAPTISPIVPTTQPSQIPEKKKKIGRGILVTESHALQHPPGECCTTVCDMLNNDIQGFTELVSPNKDQKLMFDTLVELRRQLYINGSCQCANGVWAERYGIPVRDKQIEDCKPSACEILNSQIEEYDSILLPTHRIVVIKDKLYDFRKKLYHKGNFKCVDNEEQLEKSRPGGAIDPILLSKLSQVVKRAEKEGWIEK